MHSLVGFTNVPSLAAEVPSLFDIFVFFEYAPMPRSHSVACLVTIPAVHSLLSLIDDHNGHGCLLLFSSGICPIALHSTYHPPGSMENDDTDEFSGAYYYRRISVEVDNLGTDRPIDKVQISTSVS